MQRIILRDEVKAVIERRATNAPIPTLMCQWWGVGTAEKYGEKLIPFGERYPDDIFLGYYAEPGGTVSSTKSPNYRWGFKDYSKSLAHGTGNAVDIIDSWEEFDDFLADFPDPNEAGTFDHLKEPFRLAKERGQYCLGMWWRLFHERFWGLRGMQNLMLDYYDNMDGLKLLGRKLLEFYKVIVERYAEIGCDGIFTSDDLGHQAGPMMSPEVFHELYFPLYSEFIAHVHSCGMHVFLHSCGDNTLLLPDLVAAGLDVFHPVQTGCMNLEETVKTYGDKLSFLVGVDVQHLLPEESAEGVRAGLAEVVRQAYKPNGGMLFAAGNGIMPDTPLENIEAMLDVVHSYR